MSPQRDDDDDDESNKLELIKKSFLFLQPFSSNQGCSARKKIIYKKNTFHFVLSPLAKTFDCDRFLALSFLSRGPDGAPCWTPEASCADRSAARSRRPRKESTSSNRSIAAAASAPCFFTVSSSSSSSSSQWSTPWSAHVSLRHACSSSSTSRKRRPAATATAKTDVSATARRRPSIKEEEAAAACQAFVFLPRDVFGAVQVSVAVAL